MKYWRVCSVRVIFYITQEKVEKISPHIWVSGYNYVHHRLKRGLPWAKNILYCSEWLSWTKLNLIFKVHPFVVTRSKGDTLFFALFFSQSNETWLFVDLFGLFRTREKTIVEGRLAKWGPFQKEKIKQPLMIFLKNIRRLAKWGPFQKRKKSRNLSWF